MDRHRSFYADAVDALDIAVQLERDGVGPSTAGRYRHSDVFSLAEELYARVPRHALEPEEDETPARRGLVPAAAVGLLYLLAALLLRAVPVVGLTLPLVVPLAVYAFVHGAAAALVPSFGGPARRGSWAARGTLALGVGALLALAQPVGPAQIALALGVGMAEGCATWFRHIGRSHLQARSTREFRSRMRPVLPVTVLCFLGLLAGLTAVASTLTSAYGGHGGSDQAATLVEAGVSGLTPASWAAQGLAGVALLLAFLLRRCGRGASGLGVLVLACLGAVAARAIPGHAGLVACGCGFLLAVVGAWAWTALLSPASHRALREHRAAHRA
ncbi:hypothetical protein [Streptacidiphilus fuscans]|uniref:Integral membrane protein n=1 Tax=Streptacidiphilus fuscans TaxID=2789292 RepID=A0A931AY77_9ACTN|nr:hypothetical protein [Streptacidiphilus fuscans]MBF9067619.1 hypothetical protein [Streptacidiphilus fuscans]